MRIALQTIKVTKGIISFRSNEKISDTTLVFIHGLGGDSKLFHNQLRHYAGKYHVIAIDLPGHGKSAWHALPSYRDYIDAVADVLRHQDVSRCIIFGHSMGGGVCMDIYKEMAISIQAMVLISTGAVLPVANELYTMLDRDLEFFIDYFIEATFSQNAGLLVSFAKSNIREDDKDIIRNDLNICKEMDHSAMLGSIDVPVLIVANRHDRVVPLHITRFLEEKIPQSKLVVMDFFGHIPHFDHKKEFNKVVDSFLDEIR